MTVSQFALFLFSILTGVAGQFFLKTGALKLTNVYASDVFSRIWGHVLAILMTPQLLIGLACYGLGAFTYILLLRNVDLSVAGPSVALSYVFSFLMGRFIFGETIPINRYVGMGLIISGVILMIWRKP